MYKFFYSLKYYADGCLDLPKYSGEVGINPIPNFGLERNIPDYGSMELEIIGDIESALKFTFEESVKKEDEEEKGHGIEEERKKIAISNIIDYYGLQFSNIIIFAVCCFIYLNVALQTFQSSLLMPYLKEVWELSDLEEALVGSIQFIGWIPGTFCWGYVADRYGRLFSLRLSIIGLMFTSFFTGLCTNFYMFITFQFIRGFFIPVGAMLSYLTECTPSTHRGLFLCLIHAVYAIGSCMSGVLGLGILYFSSFWENAIPFCHPYTLYIFSCLVPTPFLVISLFLLPKSLRFLATKTDQMEDKEELDSKVRKITNYIELINSINPLFCCCCCWRFPRTPKLSNFDFVLSENQASPVVIIEKTDHAEEKGEKRKCHRTTRRKGVLSHVGSVLVCCSSKNVVIFFNCMVMYWICAVVYYGIGLTTPSLIGSGLGISEYIGNILGSCCEIIGVFLPLPLMKYWGRKPALAISYVFVAFFMASSCFIDGFDKPTDSGAGLTLIFSSSILCVMLVRMTANSSFTIALTLISESLPTKFRSIGIGCGDANSKLWVPITTVFFDSFPQMEYLIPKIFFFVLAFLGVFSSVIHPVETKGKNISDE